MHDLAVRAFHNAALLCSERLFIEFDGADRVTDGEIWCESVVSIGNWFYSHKRTSRVRNFSNAVYTKRGDGWLLEYDCELPEHAEGRHGMATRQVRGEPMRQTIVWCLLAMATAALALAQPSTVARLDGSTISTAEIDATMARLMKAAAVTGAAIAVFHNGNGEFLKGDGFW